MNCQAIHSEFDERLDGQLAPDRVRIFDAHLAACSHCREEWQAYQAVWGLIAKQKTVTPSFGFAQRTVRRLHEEPATARGHFWQGWGIRWGLAGSLALVLGLSGWLTWRHVQTRREEEVYSAARQDRLEDMDVIASLDKLEGDSKL